MYIIRRKDSAKGKIMEQKLTLEMIKEAMDKVKEPMDIDGHDVLKMFERIKRDRERYQREKVDKKTSQRMKKIWER